jgi:hypothetical protein
VAVLALLVADPGRDLLPIFVLLGLSALCLLAWWLMRRLDGGAEKRSGPGG